MTSPPRAAMDWLLVRAWVEPDHERRLRVSVWRRGSARASSPDAAFLEPGDAATYVERWLTALAGQAAPARSGIEEPDEH